MQTAIILTSGAGTNVARLLASQLPATTVFTTRQEEGCLHIDSISGHVREQFHRFDAWIFIGAMGICVRSIAPCLTTKYEDPAVVCVDSSGRHAVSVLSGHVGGANELATRVAQLLGADPVITTQSDCAGLWALDTLSERFGWHAVVKDAAASGKGMNEVIRRFVEGQPVALLLEARDAGTEWMEHHLPAHVELCTDIQQVDAARHTLLIAVSPRVPRVQADVPVLCYVPRALHVGIGLAHQAGPADEVLREIGAVLEAEGILPEAVATVSTIDLKRDEPVVARLQETLPVRFYTAEELAEVEVPNPSPTVLKHTGTPSVSEAAALRSAALAAGGEPGRGAAPLLLLPKVKGSNYTVAAALDPRFVRRGHVEIVGAGPGDPDLVSVRGRQMLEKADLILYAGSLVPRELTACAKPGATVRSSASMDLEEQFHLMKEFYDRGAFIVRLHTGDPCLYGAIQEQMNYFDRYGMSYHITPGISAFQAAAAALRSQFTIPERVQSIILTRGEGRTPMPEREKLHLLARSQSTMCIYLSAAIAREVQEELMQEYPEDTPVAICYHLTWKDERIYRGCLKELARIVEENHLTLTTLIVVGEAIGNREGLSRLYAHDFKHLFRG